MRSVRYKHWDMAKIPVEQLFGEQVAPNNHCSKLPFVIKRSYNQILNKCV